MSRLQLEDSVLRDPYESTGYAQRALRIQEFSDLICSRLDWLEGRDRILLELIYDRGFSCRTVAKITGLRPSSVGRRIRTLVKRILSREYQICLLCRNELSALQMKIAREHFILGMSRPAISLQHRISLYCVDLHLHHLKNLIADSPQKKPQGIPARLKEGA